MATRAIQPSALVKQGTENSINFNLTKRFNSFADSQQQWAMAWWLGSLMIVGSLFLPVTFLVVYSFNGPVVVFLGLSVLSFFATIIANMCDMGIRASVGTFFFSIGLHLIMIISTLILFYLQ